MSGKKDEPALDPKIEEENLARLRAYLGTTDPKTREPAQGAPVLVVVPCPWCRSRPPCDAEHGCLGLGSVRVDERRLVVWLP